MTTAATLREKLITPIERERIEVELPEIGESVWMQSINGKELADFQRRLFGKTVGEVTPQRMADASRYLLTLTLCDAEGTRILSETDAKLLEQQHAGMIQRLAQIALQFTNASASIEDEAGNSDATS